MSEADLQSKYVLLSGRNCVAMQFVNTDLSEIWTAEFLAASKYADVSLW